MSYRICLLSLWDVCSIKWLIEFRWAETGRYSHCSSKSWSIALIGLEIDGEIALRIRRSMVIKSTFPTAADRPNQDQRRVVETYHTSHGIWNLFPVLRLSPFNKAVSASEPVALRLASSSSSFDRDLNISGNPKKWASEISSQSSSTAAGWLLRCGWCLHAAQEMTLIMLPMAAYLHFIHIYCGGRLVSLFIVENRKIPTTTTTT